jgi:hypothetical protein
MWEYTVEGAEAKEIEEQGKRMREQSTERVIAGDRHHLSTKYETVGEESSATSAATGVASTTAQAPAPLSTLSSHHKSVLGTSPPSSSSSPVSVATPSLTMIRREDCYYELSGVVLHCGSARSGHYYSLVRESDSRDRDRGNSSDRDGDVDRVNDKDRGDGDMANEGSTNRRIESYGDIDILDGSKDTGRGRSDRSEGSNSNTTPSRQLNNQKNCSSHLVNSVPSAERPAIPSSTSGECSTRTLSLEESVTTRRRTRRWFKLDDDIVTEFDLDNIEEEAFGGQKQTPNAFLLVYSRTPSS